MKAFNDSGRRWGDVYLNENLQNSSGSLGTLPKRYIKHWIFLMKITKEKKKFSFYIQLRSIRKLEFPQINICLGWLFSVGNNLPVRQ